MFCDYNRQAEGSLLSVCEYSDHSYFTKLTNSKYIVHGSKNGLFKCDLLTIGAFLSKRVRRFDPSTTGLDHVLVSRVLPQISAG